jgi:hypothetical protein
MEDILIPLAFFAMILGIVVISVWGGVQARKEANETIRRAIDHGQQLDADTLSSLSKPVRSAQADIRGGVIMLFLGAGLALAGAFAGGWIPGFSGYAEEAGVGLFIPAAIVGFIGLGQLVAGLMRSKKEA